MASQTNGVTGKSSGDVKVIRVSSPGDMQRSLDLRIEVFVTEQGFPLEYEVDNPKDAESAHFIAVNPDDIVIGTVRVILKTGQIGRMAVKRGYRGSGLGRILCQAVIDYMETTDISQVWAQVESDDRVSNAVGFYSKMGFRPSGPEWTKLGVQHQDMVYRFRSNGDDRIDDTEDRGLSYKREGSAEGAPRDPASF